MFHGVEGNMLREEEEGESEYDCALQRFNKKQQRLGKTKCVCLCEMCVFIVSMVW